MSAVAEGRALTELLNQVARRQHRRKALDRVTRVCGFAAAALLVTALLAGAFGVELEPTVWVSATLLIVLILLLAPFFETKKRTTTASFCDRQLNSHNLLLSALSLAPAETASSQDLEDGFLELIADRAEHTASSADAKQLVPMPWSSGQLAALLALASVISLVVLLPQQLARLGQVATEQAESMLEAAGLVPDPLSEEELAAAAAAAEPEAPLPEIQLTDLDLSTLQAGEGQASSVNLELAEQLSLGELAIGESLQAAGADGEQSTTGEDRIQELNRSKSDGSGEPQGEEGAHARGENTPFSENPPEIGEQAMQGEAGQPKSGEADPDAPVQAMDMPMQGPGQVSEASAGEQSAANQMGVQSDGAQQTDGFGPQGSDGPSSGQPGGPQAGESQLYGDATTLAVELELAVLEREEHRDQEKEPDEIVLEGSEAATAEVSYQQVRSVTYSPEDPLAPQLLLPAYRGLVKRYFEARNARAEREADLAEGQP